MFLFEFLVRNQCVENGTDMSLLCNFVQCMHLITMDKLTNGTIVTHNELFYVVSFHFAMQGPSI